MSNGREQPAGMLLLVSAAAIALATASGETLAQAQPELPSLEQLLPSGDASASGRIIQMFGLITVLSLAPGILVMVTCFTRFIVVLSFLRSGLGLPTTPANIVMVSLALFMTFHVMTPTLDKAWRDGVEPLNRGEISEQVALQRIAEPFRKFMLSQVRDEDVELFISVAQANAPEAQVPDVASPQDLGLRLLVPAFMISELRRAFEIGFLILLPFLVIDLVVATLIMSMGMMMLPPTVISLPFKVLFFVLIDGWSLLAGGLMRSVG